jgi:hypothetical protein
VTVLDSRAPVPRGSYDAAAGLALALATGAAAADGVALAVGPVVGGTGAADSLADGTGAALAVGQAVLSGLADTGAGALGEEIGAVVTTGVAWLCPGLATA